MIRAAVIIGRTTPIIRTRIQPSRQRPLSRILRSLLIQGNLRAARLRHQLRRQLRRKLRNYRLRVRRRSRLHPSLRNYRLLVQHRNRKPSNYRLRVLHQSRIRNLTRSISRNFPAGASGHNLWLLMPSVSLCKQFGFPHDSLGRSQRRKTS